MKPYFHNSHYEKIIDYVDRISMGENELLDIIDNKLIKDEIIIQIAVRNLLGCKQRNTCTPEYLRKSLINRLHYDY